MPRKNFFDDSEDPSSTERFGDRMDKMVAGGFQFLGSDNDQDYLESSNTTKFNGFGQTGEEGDQEDGL